MKLTPAQEVLSKAMTEKQLQAHIVAAAAQLGYLCYHTFDSRKSGFGFPDLIIVDCAQGRVLALECKRQGKLPTAAQIAWLEALGAVAGISARVVYPADWLSGWIEAQLYRNLVPRCSPTNPRP